MKTHLLMILALAVPALARTTVKDTLVKHWKTSGEFTIAVANAMPAGGYTFRPNPEEMSYGELMAHIAGANLCGAGIPSGSRSEPANTLFLTSSAFQRRGGEKSIDGVRACADPANTAGVTNV
jgi:hypothetical protein